MNPDVTVITGAYNSMPYVTRTVTSVFEQTMTPDRFEYIIVNDGSTDGTGDELDRLAAVYPGLHVIHQENSGGEAKPRNVALDLARGRYVFFLDADDYLGPETLERMVRAADENGTDVILGKMVGIGGRHAPQSMFTETQLRTTVFESRVNWTYNPMKMFRRELIERLGLRFREDMSYAADQPFTMMAYLHAGAITILADYDYVYWVERDDGGNITSRVQPLEYALQPLRVMLPMIADHVEPGPSRDALMRRSFISDFETAWRSLALSTDRAAQVAALAEMRVWTDAYYNERVGEGFGIPRRCAFHLIQRGMLDELLEVVRFMFSERIPRKVVEAGRVYAAYPMFRHPPAAIPDEWFDITDAVRMTRHLESAHWEGARFVLSGYALCRGIDSEPGSLSLLLRERSTAEEYTIPLDPVPTPELTELLGYSGLVNHDAAGFSAVIDPATAADGRMLPDGLWDVYVRYSTGGFTLENRLGHHRADELDTSPTARIVPGDTGAPVVTAYYTDPHGNLTFDVGERKHRVTDLVRVDSAGWADTGRPGLIVRGTAFVSGLLPGMVRLELRDAVSGAEYAHAAAIDESNDPVRWSITVPLARAATGRPMPDGAFEVRLRVDTGRRREVHDVPLAGALPSIRWWRGPTPVRARIMQRKDGMLELTVKRVAIAQAIRRRLG
jgi:CDP-glycerol glycerophosphotransferase